MNRIMSSTRVKVLLFYKYVEIDSPEEECHRQIELCEALRILGRIRIATEGINGTVAGREADVEQYERGLRQFGALRNVELKASFCDNVPFMSLRINVRPELVASGIPPKVTSLAGPGPHVSPEQFHLEIERSDPNLVVIDVRNEYEANIGRFPGAIVLPARQFSDVPGLLMPMIKNGALQDKRVLMYCTGGVRCEKSSSMLRAYGVTNVGQLEGGIHCYLESFPDGGHFQGKNFVFDARIAMEPREAPDSEVIGRCALCSRQYDDYAPNRRCRGCRVLMLVCDLCANGNSENTLLCDAACPRLRPKQTKTRGWRRRRKQIEATQGSGDSQVAPSSVDASK